MKAIIVSVGFCLISCVCNAQIDLSRNYSEADVSVGGGYGNSYSFSSTENEVVQQDQKNMKEKEMTGAKKKVVDEYNKEQAQKDSLNSVPLYKRRDTTNRKIKGEPLTK